VDAVVTAICRNVMQTFAGVKVKLGDCAAIRFLGIDIVLSSIQSQTFGYDLFTNLGIDSETNNLVDVKSSQHFVDAFALAAEEIYYFDSPGALTRNFLNIDYKYPPKTIWSFIKDPFT